MVERPLRKKVAWYSCQARKTFLKEAGGPSQIGIGCGLSGDAVDAGKHDYIVARCLLPLILRNIYSLFLAHLLFGF